MPFLSDFNKTCICLTDIHKNLHYKISEKSIQCEINWSVWTDGWIDWQTLFCECIICRKTMRFFNLLMSNLLLIHLTLGKHFTLKNSHSLLSLNNINLMAKISVAVHNTVKCENMHANNCSNASYWPTYLFLSQILRNILGVKMNTAERNFTSILSLLFTYLCI
jgi:hypothetical protein